MTSERTPVTSGVPQGSDLGPVLFIIYINDIDLCFNSFISKFADDLKINNAVRSQGERRSLQEDLCKISDWTVKWEMPYNINKYQFLQVGSRNIKNDYEIHGIKIKDLGISVMSNIKCKLKFAQQCNVSVIKANRMMGLVKRKISFKNNDVLPLYNSFVRPHLEYAVKFWNLAMSFCKRHC